MGSLPLLAMTPLHDAGSLPFGCGAAPNVVCSAARSCILQPTQSPFPLDLHHSDSTVPSHLLNLPTNLHTRNGNMATIKGPGAPKTYDGK